MSNVTITVPTWVAVFIPVGYVIGSVLSVVGAVLRRRLRALEDASRANMNKGDR